MSRRGFGVAAGLDPEIATPLAARCQELGYSSMWSNDHPGAKGLETLAEYAKGADRIELGVAVIALDRQSPDRDRSRYRPPRHRPRTALARPRRGLHEKPLTTMREALPAAARGASRRPARARRDGPEDVRLRRRRVGRRLLQLDDPRVRRSELANGSRPAPGKQGATRRPCSATCAPRSAPTPRSRLAKDESLYRDMHQGYRSHFDRQGGPGGNGRRRGRERRRRPTGALPLPRS